MSDKSEEGATAGGQTSEGNLTAVQSISAKLLEVTRLAEKLDARLCEAGARSRALNPAGEDDAEFIAAVEDVRDANVGTSPTVRDVEQTMSTNNTEVKVFQTKLTL